MSDKRNQLEAIATEAVQRSGFSNLSFRSLADQVGVKSSSVHYYFPEKADLATAIIENYTNDFMGILDTIQRQNDSLKDKLTAFIKIFQDVGDEEKFCLCGMMSAETEILNDNNRSLLIQYFKKLEEWLFNQYEMHQDQITNQFDSKTLASLTLSGLEGAMLLDRVEVKRHRLLTQKALILSFID